MENKIKLLFIKIPKTGTTSIRTVFNLPAGHHTLGLYQELNAEYDYSFTFVRNTYTRLVSWYRFHHDYEIDGFRKWIQNGCPVDWGGGWLASWQDSKPLDQMLYIKNKEGKVDVDFIGFFENIKEDYKLLCNELKIIEPPELTHIIPKRSNLPKNHKTTFSYNSKEFYDIRTKEMVDILFEEEIKYFKFKFFEQ